METRVQPNRRRSLITKQRAHSGGCRSAFLRLVEKFQCLAEHDLVLRLCQERLLARGTPSNRAACSVRAVSSLIALGFSVCNRYEHKHDACPFALAVGLQSGRSQCRCVSRLGCVEIVSACECDRFRRCRPWSDDCDAFWPKAAEFLREVDSSNAMSVVGVIDDEDSRGSSSLPCAQENGACIGAGYLALVCEEFAKKLTQRVVPTATSLADRLGLIGSDLSIRALVLLFCGHPRCL